MRRMRCVLSNGSDIFCSVFVEEPQGIGPKPNPPRQKRGTRGRRRALRLLHHINPAAAGFRRRSGVETAFAVSDMV